MRLPTAPLVPHRLSGNAWQRGRGQSALAGVDAAAIRATADARIEAARPLIETAEAQRFLAAQRAFAEQHCAPELEELAGICDGFGLDLQMSFALLHLAMLAGRFETDGCTAWARARPGSGAVLAKNRDLSGAHRHGQDAFLHQDPAWRAGPVFCLGTLGAPGAYSSGMNAAGLALADTAIAAPRHGIGWLRYFLMTRILATCSSVAEAIALIGSLRHAGGGSLILADAQGATAAVELLAEGAVITPADPAFRTNHFWSEAPARVAVRLAPPALRSTLGRRATLAAALDAGLGLDGRERIAATMADHGDAQREALCRHGEADQSHTVSCVIYETAPARITLSRQAPCAGLWQAVLFAALRDPAGSL